MKVLTEILAVLVLGGLAFTANSHAAQAKVTDPRKCGYGPARKADCARDSAMLIGRRVLGARVGQKLWQGQLRCTSAGTLLKWRCWFDQQHPELPAKGYVAVTYRATHTGWHVYTTIVPT